MKRLLIYLAVISITFSAVAQSPQKMSYQCVIRNSGGTLVANQGVGIKISILQGSPTGTLIYQEIYNPNPLTNANGLVAVEIGGGIPVTGSFGAIDWSAGTYFIKTETDPTGGTNYTITGTSQLLSVPYALYAKTAETVTGKAYHVGDFAQGGIVFWVDETGQNGLVAAKEDQSAGIRWYAGTFGNTQAKGDGLFAGEANTSIIIAAQVAIGDDGANYAARICNMLQVTEGGKTYGDWYIPSKEELNLMYQNRAIINATALANGGSDFANNYYWSSTEYDIQDAWAQGFVDGFMDHSFKVDGLKLRAIRAF